MYKYKESYVVMLGVRPGYGDTNVSMTEALEIAKTAVEEVFRDHPDEKPDSILPALAIYPTFWGAPKGGEVGVLLKGNAVDKDRVTELISLLMAELGQMTATIEWNMEASEGEQESVYVRNEYKEGETPSRDSYLQYQATKTDMGKCIHFEEKMENCTGLAVNLQKAQEATPEGEYVITGVLAPNRNGVAIFSGTQNAAYGQDDPKKYRESLRSTINRAEDLRIEAKYGKKSVYLASPFFNEQELEAVKKAEACLRERGMKVFSPREHEDREHEVGTRKWSETIFRNDRDAIDRCEVVVMLYHGGYSDSGTVWECGYAYAKGKPVVVVHLGKDSNLMVHEGCYTNLNGLEELATYPFGAMPRKLYEGPMF